MSRPVGVLSDAEIQHATLAAIGANDAPSCECRECKTRRDIARAVEQAVLEKEMYRAKGVSDDVWNHLGFSTGPEFVAWMNELRRIAVEGGDLHVPFIDGTVHGISRVFPPGARVVSEEGRAPSGGRMSRHLRYNLYDAPMRHAQVVMAELGITYQHATPQSICDQWWFWNCQNVPDPLPKFLSDLNIAPHDAIGHGLSKEKADAILNFGKGPSA